MRLLFLDFETYYGGDYTLSKMPVHTYVLDRRFEVMTMAWAIDDEPVKVVVGDDIADVIASLPIEDMALVGHNLQFDGYILSRRYGRAPKLYLDTMSLARAVLGARLRSHSLDSVAEYLLGEGKRGAAALAKVRGKRLNELSPGLLDALVYYNRMDVEITRQIFERLMAAWRGDAAELKLLDWTIRAACLPVFMLDHDMLLEELREEERIQEYMIKRAGVSKSTLMSNQKFAEALQALGVEPPMKVSDKTEEMTWAFDKKNEAFVALLGHKDKRVRRLVEARLAVKSTIAITRAEKFLQMAEAGSPVPLPLQFSGAVQTHRFSGGGGINAQNLPKESRMLQNGKIVKVPGRIRLALRAPKGSKTIVADSSNIELRMCHWLAGNEELLNVVRNGGDPYCEFASKLYGEQVNPKAFPKEHPERARHDRMRTLGKIGMLALQYGMGVSKLIDTVWAWTGETISTDEGELIVATYRNTNTRIKSLWKTLDNMLHAVARGVPPMHPKQLFPALACLEMGYDLDKHDLWLTMPSGLRFNYFDIRQEDDGGLTVFHARKGSVQNPRVRIWGGVVTENITQGLASLVIRQQMAKIIDNVLAPRNLPPESLALQVHDEIVLVVPEQDADDVLQEVLAVMSEPPEWAPGLPLAAEGAIGDTYGRAK